MPKQSIATQLIILLVLSVLAAQIPIAAVFLSRTDTVLDVFEQKVQVHKIADTYQSVNQRASDDHPMILRASNGIDLSFSISSTQMFKGALTEKKYLEWFADKLGDVEVGFEDRIIGAMDQWRFWFSDQEELCFEAYLIQDLSNNCPYKAYSIKLDDGRWLNVVSGLAVNNSFVLVPVLISAFITLVGFLIVIAFAIRKITSPLRDLENAAEQLGRGQNFDMLAVKGPKELSTMVEAFNVMQERLTRFIHDRTHMLAAISHDLRTPITSLRIRVEFIEDIELRAQMTQTIEDMQAMVDSCLSFAHQDIVEEETRHIDLVKLIQSALDDFSEVSFASQMSEYDYPCRPVNLKRAVRNIIENGIKYGEKVKVTMAADNRGVLIEVQDNGPGIPEEKIDEVFDPFIRLDKARNVDSGSVGLGLTIARTVIHKHGGTIEAKNNDEGLNIIVRLPIISC